MKEHDGIYLNDCNRKSGACLFSILKTVPKEAYWEYYDTSLRSYVFLDCKIHMKFETPSLLQIEETEKFQSGVGSATYETPDLQLADYNGRWMTRSSDEDCYPHRPYDEPKKCDSCDMVCDIRDDERYLEDGSCPFPETMPEPTYWRVGEQQMSGCGSYLSPVMLLNLDAVNRKRRRKAYNFLKGYLSEKKWLDLHINSERRMIDIWDKHYVPLRFYLPSVETLWLYVRGLKNEKMVSHLVSNVEKWCVNLEDLLEEEWERTCWGKVTRY